MFDIHFFDAEGFGVYENIPSNRVDAMVHAIRLSGGEVSAVIQTSENN